MPKESSIVLGIVHGPESKGLLAIQPPLTASQRTRFTSLLEADFGRVLDYMPSSPPVADSSEFEITVYPGISAGLALIFAEQSARTVLEEDGHDVTTFRPVPVEHSSGLVQQYIGGLVNRDPSTVHQTGAVAY